MVIVIGTLTIFLTGTVFSWLRKGSRKSG